MSYLNTTNNTTNNTIITTSGTTLNTSANMYASNIEFDKSLIEYIELLYQLIGVDMTFDKFKNLSNSEKQTFVRDIKIKKLLDK